MERVNSLQALRFLAALGVVYTHTCHQVMAWDFGGATKPDYLIDIGAAGVDVFFVLSGFVIARTGPLANPPPSGRMFFWRRLSRVAPLFWTMSLPIIAMSIPEHAFSWAKMSATFLFWPAAGQKIVLPFLTVGWTLGFEMIFYSAMAFVLVDGRLRRNFIILVAVTAVIVVIRHFSGWNPLRILGNAIFLEFVFGVLLAFAWPWLRNADLRLGWLLLGAGLCGFLTDVVLGFGDAVEWQAVLLDTNALHRVFVFGLPAAAIVVGALICDRVLRGPAIELCSHLGDASYSIYVTHVFSTVVICQLWAKMFDHRWPVAQAIAMVAGAVGGGVAAYRLVERPIQRDLKQFTKRISTSVKITGRLDNSMA